MKYLLATIILLGSLHSWATLPKDDKKKDGAESGTAQAFVEGVVYSLPRTGFNILVDVKRDVFIPGPYASYAKKYLGYTNVQFNSKTYWSIKGIDVDVFAESDPEAMFKALDTLASRVSLSPDGRLLAINLPTSSEGIEILGNTCAVHGVSDEEVFPDMASSDYYDLILDSTTGAETMVQKNIEEMAQEAADYLMRLRKKRAYTILSPSDLVPEDGKAYEAFLQEAKRLEKEYVALFLGKTISSEQRFTFIYVPKSEEIKNE